MEIYPLLQAKLLLYTFLLGICCGAAFDLFGEITAQLNHLDRVVAKITRFVTDFVTVTASGVTVILLCYYFSKGQFRAFCILGIGVGLLIYFFTLSPLIKRIYRAIFHAFFYIFRLVLHPLLKIFKYIERILQKLLHYVLKALAKKLNWVYNICVRKAVLSKARKGFLRGRYK